MAKFWAFVKAYWQLAVGFLIAVAGFFIFTKQKSSFSDQLSDIKKAHEEEIKKINEAREEERKAHIENERKLNETLMSIQQQYEAAKRDLDEKKRKEIENIVKKWSDDPTELSKQLSEAAGFTVVIPTGGK